MKKFTLTADHISLIQKMLVEWNDEQNFGAPGVNTKRPYGNGSVAKDIAKILGVAPNNEDGELSAEQENEMIRIHLETGTALQIVLCLKTFEPGSFTQTTYSRNSWIRD